LINAESTIELLINKGANIQARNQYQWTPSHTAVGSSRLDVVKILCEKGANIDAVTNTGETPLHTAVQYNLSRVVEFLLQAGASTAMKLQGLTPEVLAIAEGHPEVTSLLMRHLMRSKVCSSSSFAGTPHTSYYGH
jgi:ankyrin repeat protein